MKIAKKRLFLIIILILLVCIAAIPLMKTISKSNLQYKLQELQSENNVICASVLLGIQIFQIVVAFIPGEPIEILSGVLYGTFGGLIICSIGCITASAIIFSLSKRFGRKLVKVFVGEDRFEKWKWVKDSKCQNTITFILFFIPGTPKDILTYVIGISDMKLNEFIVISTIARIPSILTSTLAGSAIADGNRILTLVIFVLSALLGIMYICFKDRFANKYFFDEKSKIVSRCECLDVIECTNRKKIYPIIYMRISFNGEIDISRLKEAIQISSTYVPEILCSFDWKTGMFMNCGYTVDNVIISDDSINSESDYMKWDLSCDTQLKIKYSVNDRHGFMIIGISHILSDGRGFLQYLYLLSDLYNRKLGTIHLYNNRNVRMLLSKIYGKNTYSFRLNSKSKRNMGFNFPKEISEQIKPHCISLFIKNEFYERLCIKAHKNCVTLNDVFFTAYFRVLHLLKKDSMYCLPCPVDLRRYAADSPELTAANLTGIYIVSVTIKDNNTFDEILIQVKNEIQRQKDNRCCLKNIKLLSAASRCIPFSILNFLCSKLYHPLPISYTNVGIIDDSKLQFGDCQIEHCYLTGTYRKPPDFQLSVSTYKSRCTLNCTFYGNQKRKEFYQELLKLIQEEILNWIENP